MLCEDPLGGQVGDFEYRGTTCDYHVEGAGGPVLITRGLSAARGSYDWRYIFDCLAGTFRVYALDVIGPSDRPEFGRAHYAGLIEAFIRDVIREKASVIACPAEAPFVLRAAFQAPGLVGKVMLAYPHGPVKIRTRGTIGREAVERRLGIPSIEEITGGWPWSAAACQSSLRRFAMGRKGRPYRCTPTLHRSGASPGGIDPLRFCDDAIRFLG